MTTALLVSLGLALLTMACAAKAVWLDKAALIEDYPQAHVRVYRAGLHCRVEVVLPTASLVTLPTQCLHIPHLTP